MYCPKRVWFPSTDRKSPLAHYTPGIVLRAKPARSVTPRRAQAREKSHGSQLECGLLCWDVMDIAQLAIMTGRRRRRSSDGSWNRAGRNLRF